LNYFRTLATSAKFDNMVDSDVSLFFMGISSLSPDSLDFTKIKCTLSSEHFPQSEKLCLLQALRWLFTKTTAHVRHFAVHAFIENDVLGLKSEDGDYRNRLFHCMLSPAPTYLKEVGFINFKNFDIIEVCALIEKCGTMHEILV